MFISRIIYLVKTKNEMGLKIKHIMFLVEDYDEGTYCIGDLLAEGTSLN